MFDHVLLLAPGGRTIYFGETGDHASTIGSYFARYGAVMSPEENPAEFIISTVAQAERDWPNTWIESPESASLQEKISQLAAIKPLDAAIPTETGAGQYALPIYRQTIILMQRQWLSVWRNGQYNFSRLTKSIFFALLVAFTFFHITNSPSGLQNHMLGILLSTWLVTTLAVDIQVVWFEKWSIFEGRERNGIYDWSALLTSMIAVELPWMIVIFTLVFFCTYWTFGFFSTASIAGFVYFMYILLAFFALGFSYIMAALFQNSTMAGYADSLFWVVLLMFSGAANPRSGLNSFYYSWIFWADPLTYFFEATVSTVLHGVDVHCEQADLAVFDPPSGQTCAQYLTSYMEANPGYLQNPSATSGCGYCKYSSGDDYAHTLDYYYGERWRDWGVFLGFCITNFALAYLITWIRRVKMREWKK